MCVGGGVGFAYLACIWGTKLLGIHVGQFKKDNIMLGNIMHIFYDWCEELWYIWYILHKLLFEIDIVTDK